MSITPMKDGESDETIFEVKICNGDWESENEKGNNNTTPTVRSRRCVCALEPNFSQTEHAWETDLHKDLGPNYVHASKRILRSDE